MNDDKITGAVRAALSGYVQQATVADTIRVAPGEWLLMCPAHNNLDLLIGDIAEEVRKVIADQPLRPAGEPADGPPPHPLPVVYAWCVDKAGGTGNEHWMAVAEDGTLMGSHVSSGRAFGADDVHQRFPHQRDLYRKKFGGLGQNFYQFVVLPDGEHPPAEVLRRMRSWRYSVWVGDQAMTVQVNPLVPKDTAYIVVEPDGPR